MKTNFDVIVAGLGGMGSAICWELTRRTRLTVLGIEADALNSPKGASFGQSRMIRQAYFEDSRYLPLIKRSYQTWLNLQDEFLHELMVRTGVLLADIGLPASDRESLKSLMKQHSIAVETFDGSCVVDRFGFFRLPDAADCLLERDAGYLRSDLCLKAFVRGALEKGLEIITQRAIRDFAFHKSGSIEVATDEGTFSCRQLVLSVGAWLNLLQPNFPMPLKVTPAPLYWFHGPKQSNQVPCYIVREPSGVFYGFPQLTPPQSCGSTHEQGYKVAEYAGLAEEIHPDQKNTLAVPPPSSFLLQSIHKYLPHLNAEPIDRLMCMYHSSADENFIIDRLPGQPNILVATGCSGHAFKFLPIIAETVADMVCGAARREDTRFLALR